MAFNLTLEHVQALLKGNKEVDAWHRAMVKVFPKYKIDTPERIAGFIAQCAHESLNFTIMEENLNYRAETLDKIFPKYFVKAGRKAADFAKQPEKIANIVYGGRMGNTQPGDGWRFRGRGVIQLTGRDNYTAFGKTLNKSAEQVAEYVTGKEGAIESACWYWNSRNINKAADAGDIVLMTKLINGGTIGLEDRKKHYLHALEVLTGKAAHHAPAAPAAAAPSAAPAASAPASRVLKVGSKGPQVKKLQEALGVAADGSFGPGTEAALKTWQAANGLEADGIAGPATLAKLVK
jgi:putative chitinase